MNLNLISKNRSELMGLSIISIMTFHFTEDYVTSGGSNLFAKLYYLSIGSVGVDVFLFLSGMGLYYSYSKKPDPVSFYKKRFSRILKTYVLFGGIFWIIKDFLINQEPWHVFIKDFLLVTFWTEGNKNLWFVSLIVVLYILFPIIYNISYRKRTPRPWLFAISMVLIILITLMANYLWGVFEQIEIAVTRIPVFCFGVFIGYFVMNQVEIPSRKLIGFCTLGILLQATRVLLDYPLPIKRYFVSLWGVVLVLIVCWVLEHLKSKTICKVLSKVGSYSFELYLSHVGIRVLYNLLGKPTYMLSNYFQVIFEAIIVSFIGKKAIDWLSGILVKSGR